LLVELWTSRFSKLGKARKNLGLSESINKLLE
jgi:hypothetical protein